MRRLPAVLAVLVMLLPAFHALAAGEDVQAAQPYAAEFRQICDDSASNRYRYEMEPNDIPRYADWTYPEINAYGRISKVGDIDYWKVKAPQDVTAGI